MYSWYWSCSLSPTHVVVPPTLTVKTEVGEVPVFFLDSYGLNVCDSVSSVVLRGPRPTFVGNEGPDQGWVTITPENVFLLRNIPKCYKRGIGYFLYVVGTIAWIVGLCGQTTVDYYSRFSDLSAMQADYNSLSDELIRVNLKIQLLTTHVLLRAYSGLSVLKRHFVYRSRRCTSPPAGSIDVLKSLKAFITPTGIVPRQDYISTVGSDYCQRRRIYLTGEPVRASRSNKATCLSSRGNGGFDGEVGFLSKVKDSPIYVNPRPKITQVFSGEAGGSLLQDRPFAESLFRDADRYRLTYFDAFNTSISILLAIDRPLLAFCTQILERGGKTRVPCVPEGFAQIVAKGIGGWGIDALKQLFPVEFNNHDIKIESGGYFKSGDYIDSTSFIFFEAGRTAWDMVLDNMPLEADTKVVFKACIAKLIGPHLMFSSSETRSKMRKSLFTVGKAPLRGKFAAHVPCNEQVPLIGRPNFSGSTRGRTVEDSSLNYPSSMRDLIIKMASLSVFATEFIISVRGILMSYGIAVTALFILNLIPHWEMKTLRGSTHLFFCKGDDNVSKHPNRASCQALELKKIKSGMVPHDSRKAYESTHGCLLAEVLYVTNGKKKYLDVVDAFSPKILFPDSGKAMELVTLPYTVMQELKKLNCDVMKSRVTAYVLDRFKKDYSRLRQLGISVTGPDSIVRWLPDDGGINSAMVKGLYTAPQPSSEYPVDVNPYDYLVAKKMAVSSGECTGFYRSRRVTLESLADKLSSVPVSDPYSQYRVPQGHSSGGVPVIIENIERLSRTKKSVFTEIPFDYTLMCGGPERAVFVIEKPTENPYTQQCIALEEETGCVWPLPDIRIDGKLTSFHTDVFSLALGYEPTSEPVQELSLAALASYPQGIIIDARNSFPNFKEDRVTQSDCRPGLSLIASTYQNLILKDKEHGLSHKLSCVYYVVLEQPGLPELSYMSNCCVLLICRPQRNSLGADTEVLAIRNLIRSLNPSCRLSVITKDMGLRRRLLA